MATFVLFSHDGYGLGHVRRNTLIARALVELEPSARVVLVSGTAVRPRWLVDRRFALVRVPPVVKGPDGVYRGNEAALVDALRRRAETFERVIEQARPDVVLVDRHPYGIGGELHAGLERARAGGATLLLGLRDILDHQSAVASEIAGAGWSGVEDLFEEALVYGGPALCDHEREYGIPLPVRYTGWVTTGHRASQVDPSLVVVAAGGGGDGEDVLRLGVELLLARPERHAVVVAGPYAKRGIAVASRRRLGRRLRLEADPDGCAPWFARAGAVLQMGGYNTTFEALAAGARPIVAPRRVPRREQVIRASRLSALGLADVVDAGVAGDEVSWLLDRPRRLAPGALAEAGVSLDGAHLSARRLLAAARVPAC